MILTMIHRSLINIAMISMLITILVCPNDVHAGFEAPVPGGNSEQSASLGSECLPSPGPCDIAEPMRNACKYEGDETGEGKCEANCDDDMVATCSSAGCECIKKEGGISKIIDWIIGLLS